MKRTFRQGTGCVGGGDKTLRVQGAFEEQKEKGTLASARVDLRRDAALFFPTLTELS